MTRAHPLHRRPSDEGTPNDPSRRAWLRRSGGAVGATLASALLGNLALPGREARAAGYRALVCIHLDGGNDGLNMVVPTDDARYAKYQGVRQALAIPRDRLGAVGATAFGLHPAMASLQSLAGNGRLAPVFNVGVLARPMTKDAFRAAPANSPLIPDNLFSHSDQTNLWQSAATRVSVRTGWGGRANDALALVNPVVSVAGSARFGLSPLQAALVLPQPGQNFGANEMIYAGSSYAPNAARAAALAALYRQPQATRIGEKYAQIGNDAFAVSDRLGAIVKATPGNGGDATVDAAFASLWSNGQFTTRLAGELYQIAKLIVQRATLGGDRHIFYAQLGGFDLHGNQVLRTDPTAGNHATLLKELADAVAAFHAAMAGVGLGDSVTTFTQSEFGRTFVPNATLGTDHAWGNTQLVFGGAVRGNATYGAFPELTPGGVDDVGLYDWEKQGRWIPTTSVDTYAATLLRWLGADDATLDRVLPNLASFAGQRTLGFLG